MKTRTVSATTDQLFRLRALLTIVKLYNEWRVQLSLTGTNFNSIIKTVMRKWETERLYLCYIWLKGGHGYVYKVTDTFY